MLSPSRFIGWRSSPVPVAASRLVMKTRPGLSLSSRRAENRCVPWFDVTDYRHSSGLAGDVDCENLGLGLLRQTGCSSCRRLWMRDRLLFRNGGAAVQNRGQYRNDRGRDRRRNGPGWPRRGRKDFDDGAACVESQRVIGPTGAVRVMVATKPVDFRKGAEGLAALVRETMTADPFSGAVYVFRAKRAREPAGLVIGIRCRYRLSRRCQ
jgi:hypothetical protein